MNMTTVVLPMKSRHLCLLGMGAWLASVAMPALGLSIQDVPPLVRSQNHDVKAAVQDVEAAHMGQYASYGPLFPKIEIKTTWNRMNDDLAIDIGEIHIQKNLGTMKLDLAVDPPPITVQEREFTNSYLLATQPLFTGGRIISGIRAANAQKTEADLSLVRETDARTAEALARYFQAVAARDITVVLQSMQESLDRMEAMAKALVTSGMAAKFSLLQVSVAQSDLKARIEESRAKSALADLAFKTSTGLQQVKPVIYDSPLKVVAITGTLDAYKTQSLDKRPEFGILQSKADQASALKAVRTGEMLPMAYAFYKRELREDQLTVLQPKWIAGIGLDIPITAALTSFPERQRAAAIQAKVGELDAKARHDIPLQVEACHAAATSLAAGLRALDAGIEQGREALRLSEVRFKSGSGSSLETLKAQTDLETLLVRRLVYLEEYNRKLIELHAAAGDVTEYIAAYNQKTKAN